MDFIKIRSGGIRLFLLIAFLGIWAIGAQAQQPPSSLGYVGSQVVKANDTLQVFISGGALNSQHGALSPTGQAVVGMPLIRFAPVAFEKDMFVSKGYYPDYVLLTWELARFINQVTFFRIYRKLLSAPDTDYVQVATVSKDVTSWRDEFAEASVMYEYKLKAEGLYAFEQNFVNRLEGVGFRLPSGSVSGRVTFVDEGGAPVKDVTIIAETDDEFGSTSALLDGSTSYLGVSHKLDHNDWKFQTQFAFQAWVKPDASGTTPATLFQKGTQYNIEYSPGTITFDAGASSVSLNFTEKPNEYFHVSAVRTVEDSLKIFVIYESDEIFKNSVYAGGVSTPANNDQVYIGRSDVGTQYFKGNIDEIRIWKKAPTDASIRRESLRIISGTENGLTAYYRLNEGTGSFFYDLSREGFAFHEHHGSLFNIGWSSAVPTASQLSVKGYTDANGNYLITGIPYTSSGSLYTFTPAFGTHKFSPVQASRFLGPGSTTFSAVNFIDKSSFKVTGYVYYAQTRFPVSGVQLEVDGVSALSTSGTPVVTDGNGLFSVDVPIGEHRLQLVKQGHEFRNDGYFPTDSTFFDFQTDLNIDVSFFRDTTLVKVIGKVVGGPVEEQKSTGLGKSKNNIGDASVILKAQKPFKLIDGTTVTDTWNNEFFKEGVITNYGTTEYTVTPDQITINPDTETGEFYAYLLPEKYNIFDISAGTYNKTNFGSLVGLTIDLTNAFINKTEVDSTLLDPSDANAGYAIDSTNFNQKLNLVLRVNPSVTVTSENPAKARFWDAEVSFDASTNIPVVNGDGYGDWLTEGPIFTQRKQYKALVSVFEEYTHPDNGVDKVPVVDGKVQIQNGLAIKSTRQEFKLDNKGQVLYEFLGGVPNTATGGVGDYQKSMTVQVFSGKGGAITTPWPMDGSSFAGYVLGGRPVGNNFVTTGPNIVSMILRDPHGSGSYSYYETGTTNTTEMSFEVSNAENSAAEVTFQMGADVTIQTGFPGATVETEVDIEADLALGLEQSLDWIDNETTIHTVTNTQRWSTSPDPAFVGSNGDVFIGNSTNIVYGNSVFVQFVNAADPSATGKTVSVGTNNYKIGLQNAIRLNPEFGTAFQYTQNHIENSLIPDLEFLRNEYLKSKNEGEYDSKYGVTDPLFGSDNTSSTRSATGITGDSYDIKYPTGYELGTGAEYVDTVAFYNKQIKGWKDLLARNEREKLESTLISNYSYDAGTIFESSTTIEDTKTRTETFEFSISPSISESAGVTVNGVGLSMSMDISYSHRETESTTSGQTTSQTFGYVLADSDAGDYYSIDVRDPGSHTGPVFKVKGGQSMCPYVDEELTKYYTPGASLSAATVRREVPGISVEKNVLTDILDGKPANFKLFLSNVSDSGDDAWYQLSIDESSVTGALVEIDGASLGDGRVFYIPAGGTVTKILSISQVDPSITVFNDVTLILHSLCQYDPGDNWEDISASVSVSAYFQPSCSDIKITSPDDLWLLNTSQIQYNGNDIASIPITIGVEGYDLAHASFEKIEVQYKSTSSSLWLTDKIYYLVDDATYQAAPEPKGLVNGAATLSHLLEMKDLPDRNYEVRVKTVCSDGTVNFSETRRGIKDVKRPQQFGTPQPGDGILSPGEDIMITFDEPIERSILTTFNFDIKGVLNGQPIAHNSVLFFDGIDDNASVIEGVNLLDKSFTVEFWVRKQSDNVNGVIYSQGNMEIGFNSSNRFYATLGTKTFVSTATYTGTTTWMHFAVVYDYADDEIAFYKDDQIALNKTVVNENFMASGRIYFGQAAAGGKNFHGYIHDMRVWEAARGQGAIVANMSVTQRGDEVGLSGFWPMDEASGLSALDKSRSHHAVLNGADWRVFPVGYSRSFAGAGNVQLPTGTIPVSNQMDMTIEFWMKAGPQTNTVMFSNGRGNGDDSTPPFANIWVMGADASGKLYVLNNGTRLTVDKNVFDNNWHHVAVVVKRIANTTLYVDGNVEKFTSSKNVGGMTGAQLALGARQFFTGGSYTFDRHYTGRLDEFRLWGLARTKELLEMDRNASLSGDETGLLAYLPFETFDINQIPTASLNSTTNEGTLTAISTSSNADPTDVPKLKLARPVQNVAYNWVVNNDKIILNITEDPAVVEKTVLEITVRDIEDLYQNRLASPITWTAYVNKNTVLWNEQIVNLEKQVYKELEFSTKILNLGGTEQTYQISNIPSWLEVDQPTGNLLPNSSKTLKMTVKASAQIGKYEHSLYLVSDFGFQEKFDLNLRVFEEAPNWTVDPQAFEYDMSIIGTIRINGILSTDPDDVIAAEVDGEVRGVANLEYVPAYDMYMFFMDVYSNASYGENISFKVWNADQGKVHLNVTPSIDFMNNTVVGSPSIPQEFLAKDEVLVTYNLKKGWNWLSFNFTTDDMVSSQALFGELSPANGDLIKTIDRFDQFSTTTGWMGSLTSSGGFDVETGYKMRLTNAQIMNLSGVQVDIDTIAIDLVPGWNWIGYPAASNLELNTAMGNLNFSNGDFVKGQNGFALYDDRLGWLGSLEFLAPTRGYMLKVANAATLTFPDPANFRVMASNSSTLDLASPWNVDPSQFANTMSIVVQVDLCGATARTGDFLGVFVNGQCRGAVNMTSITGMEEGLFFLTAYSNSQDEQLEYKYYSAALKETFALNYFENFRSDQLLGTVAQPIYLSTMSENVCNVITSIDADANITIYPNPFMDGIKVDLPKGVQGKVRVAITDISGRLIDEFNVSEQSFYWKGKDGKAQLKPGVYHLTMEWANESRTYKILKLNSGK